MSRRNVILVLGVLGMMYACLALPGFTRYGDHPDEIGGWLWELWPYRRWYPCHFFYPALHLYTEKLLFTLPVEIAHFKLGILDGYDFRLINHLGRVLALILALGCIVVVYLVSRSGGAPRLEALLAAAFAASFPPLVNYGRFNTTDMPNTFWTLLALYVTLRTSCSKRLAALALAGVVSGFAVSAKYLAAAYLPAMAAVLAYNAGRQLHMTPVETVRRIAFFGLVVVLTFFAVNPYILVTPAKFLHDFSWLMFEAPTYKFGVSSPIAAIGIPLQTAAVWNPVALFLGIVGLLSAARSWRSPVSMLICASLCCWYLFMFRKHWYPVRYQISFNLLLAVLVARGWGAVGGYLASRKSSTRIAAHLMSALAVVAVGWQLRNSAAVTYNFVRETRYDAARWLLDNTAPSDRVGMRKSVFTYFPVSFLPEDKIFDFDCITTGTNLNDEMRKASVRHFLASSYWTDYAGEDEKRLVEDAKAGKRGWSVAATFELKSYLWHRPDYIEFACPTIEIFERPAD